MEPFRNLLNAALIEAAARHLRRVWPGFDAASFERLALDGLGSLEMKARAMQIAAALEATLPEDFGRAAEVLEASLGPPGLGDDLAALRTSEAGLAGWIVWPMSSYVARRGQGEPERALAALHAMTQRFSAEWAIRPFIERHPELAFATLRRWTTDPSAHVRRLVSEGSRPRLPWGLQLKALIADPSPTLPLLEALQDDRSAYVRRSVANHLNDIAKDHPALVAGWLERHLPEAPATRQALLRHASRSLVKGGDARVLKAWGLGAPLRGTLDFSLAPKRITLGESLRLTLSLSSSARRAQPLVVDYAVHHVKANGSTSPKVFKGWTMELLPGEQRELVKQHPIRPITTRRYFSGAHRVDVLVNGTLMASAPFTLRVP